MIKPTDLRIGNFVEYKGKYYNVCTIGENIKIGDVFY